MGILERFFGEIRAAPQVSESDGTVLLEALLSDTVMTKKKTLEIPTVKGCIGKLASTICRLPIKLYKKDGDQVSEIKDDIRLQLLNQDTGDTLNPDEFWRAMIEDYYLGKGGFAYIHKEKGDFASLHYVNEEHVAIVQNFEPIFKDYDIYVLGESYHPYQFLKMKRKTKNGAESIPLQVENPLILSVMHNSLVFENTIVQKGGNKKGFIESTNKLTEKAIASIKNSWRNLYSNSTDNVVVLNDGATFHESSNTSVEMQLNENKKANGQEICKLFGFPLSIMTGGATDADKKEYLNAVVALATTIEAALDKDLLLEKEKGSYYFAFDLKEITRGDIKERYEAYSLAIKNNVMQIDEARKEEDLPPLDFNYLCFGLQDIFVNPTTGEVYTPNTNSAVNLGDLQMGNLKNDGGTTQGSFPTGGEKVEN